MTQDIKSWKDRRAAGCSTERAMLDEIADLRAQLAAKGQGEPVAWMHKNGQECRTAAEKKHMESLDFGLWKEIAASYTIPLYLAAPASAQPADRIKDHVLREVVNSLRDTALAYHAHGSLRGRLRQCLDPLLASGAQPDQRDSAAEAELVKAADALIERWHSRDWKQPHTAEFISRLTAAVGAVKFAAAPAAQPAKDDMDKS